MSFDASARVRSGGHPPGRIDDGALDLIAAGSRETGWKCMACLGWSIGLCFLSDRFTQMRAESE